LATGPPPWLGVSNKRILHLPLKSRSPSRLLRLLRPVPVVEPLRALAWIVCNGLYCYACIWPEGEYRVSLRRARAFDRLSGLTHELVVEADGYDNGELVWRARWDGSFLVLEILECKARVLPDGRVLCLGQESCSGPQCLAECIGSASGS